MTSSKPRPPRTRTRRPATTAAAGTPTLAELRARARDLGIRGFSRMPRDELERELAAHGQSPQPPQAAAATAPAAGAAPAAATAPAPKTAAAAGPAPVLHEDIDRLPPPREPQLGLLAQRPGVVQAYWVLPPELTHMLPPLRLRLLRAGAPHEAPIAELPLAAGSGQHYFHIAEDVDPGSVYLELGYYDSGQRFVNAIGSRLAHVPSLYAAQPAASDSRFRALHLHAGGFERDGRLGWDASITSPAAPFSAPSSPPFNR